MKRKAAILEFSPQFFRQLLRIPENAFIEDIRVSIETGCIEIRVSGVGWITEEGAQLMRASGQLCSINGAVVWDFEK